MNIGRAVRSLFLAARPQTKSHAVVLMYHRVAECDIDPWSLCVSPQQFADQIAALKREFPILPLNELIRSDARRNAVAITFDDGYADNLHAAAPVLAHHGAPACFFLTSGALDMAHEFWWDELERLLLRDATLPSTIAISVGSRRQFDPGRAAEPATDLRGQIRANPPWNAGPNTRLGFFYLVWRALRELDEQARRTALDEIAAQLEGDSGTRASHRTLTSDEAKRLAAVPGIEVGAHSVTHAVLPSLKPDAQSREIGGAKGHLEKLLGRPMTGFAYPFGEYGAETADLVRAAGFELACTTESGGITGKTDRFRLPRLGVEECDGQQLVRRVNELLG